MLVAQEGGVTESGKLLLCLTHQGVETRLHVGQLVANVAHEHLVERLGEVLGTASVCDILIGSVGAEELLFSPSCCKHRDVAVDVLLGTVDDTDETELERVDTTSENIESVSALVHQVELGQDTDGASTLRIHGASELETVRVGKIDIRRADSEDDAVGLGNVVCDEVADLTFNVGGLISDWDLGETGQVDEREVEDIRAVNLEVNRKLGDALVLTSYTESLVLDLTSNFVEVGEALVEVEELAILFVGGVLPPEEEPLEPRINSGSGPSRRSYGREDCFAWSLAEGV